MPHDEFSSSRQAIARVVDTTSASIARVYDAMLDGKDNYAVDREVRSQLIAVAPDIQTMTRDNREWLIRVSRFLASEVGLDQFLDLGSGLPSAENTHQVVQRLNLNARVVYVDNDPVVQAHGRALLEENDFTFFSPADLTRPSELLADPVVRKHIDFDEPLALYQISTLHHVPDDQRPHDIMAELVDALPSGSYIALSHFYDPADGSELSALAKKLEEVLLSGPMGSGRFRTRTEIEEFFADLELVSPGLVLPCDWWPDGPKTKPKLDVQQLILAGLARKP
ncbi:hypothetical protein BAY61_12250 [Prauserella marina]|uniref:S-adenosyl methyltransferase n=1 Tax=Prauserella marina TaxID=530584 RepID=A0A222VPI7_9PSEU|nr:SAM-dependent methyltransferase [Prauserella marina]ASR35641.1 hypothetical protein BAY61_12250 [Prauserella marina]PWV84491.1 S-adenosyl methyltransferase [Prauserella marina]SDC21141.1 S-adenosyl methyltransferase [Prauserella marina]